MFRKHPKIDVEPTKLDKKLILAGWALVTLNFIFVLFAYTDVPDTIPTHFNFKGEVDGIGQKSTIWVIPILNLALYWGMTLLLKKIKPHQMNYPVRVTEKNAAQLYAMSIQMLALLSIGIALTFFSISIETIGIAKKWFNSGLAFTMGMIGVLTILPFYFIYKMFKVSKT